MRALIHFHAGGDYQPQAFLPWSACQPSLSLHSSRILFLFLPYLSMFVRSLAPILSPFNRHISVSLLLPLFFLSRFPTAVHDIRRGYSDLWMYKRFHRQPRWGSRWLRPCAFAFTHVTHMPKARATHTWRRSGGETKGLQLTSISIETAHTRDIYVGKGQARGERIESRGEAICLPNEMSPRLCTRWDAASKEANDHPWNRSSRNCLFRSFFWAPSLRESIWIYYRFDGSLRNVSREFNPRWYICAFPRNIFFWIKFYFMCKIK